MVDFAAVVPVTLFFEGGYVDDPVDPGGATNFGISQRALIQMGMNLDVKTLTEAQATAIYQAKYWEPYGCPLLENEIIAAKVFDMVVNLTHSGVLRLQMALNEFYGSAVVDLDDVLGSETAGLANGVSDAELPQFILLLKQQHRAYYQAVIAARPADVKYKNGWFRRSFWPYWSVGRSWPYLPQGDEQPQWPQGA